MEFAVCETLKMFIFFLSSTSNSYALKPQVMLRVKESEVQYLKQEINSLKDELQAAQRVSR